MPRLATKDSGVVEDSREGSSGANAASGRNTAAGEDVNHVSLWTLLVGVLGCLLADR